tara:strand:- start:23407 stop:23841 length:435 start_codon:yes stop_codon:yes gene_type:complete
MRNPNGQPNRARTSNLQGHLGNLGADIISLSELQLELIAVDTRDASREAFFPTLMVCLATGLCVGACPVALFGLSLWLTEVSGLSQIAALLTVSGAGLGIAAILFFLAVEGFKRSFSLLKRSRTELQSNIKWIKKILSEKHSYH